MKKFIVALLSLLLVFSLTLEGEAKGSLIYPKSTEGVIHVTKPVTKKGEFAVVQVEKAGKTYAFKLNKNEVIPVSFGSGAYTVVVAVNKKGTYYVKESKRVTLNYSELSRVRQRTILSPGVNAPHVRYTLDTKFIGWKKWSTDTKVKNVHKYVTTQFSYDYARENNQGAWYVPDYSRFMMNKMGTCYDMASLTASLLREMGVSTRLVMGYPKNYGYHSWNEVYVNGKWLVIDTTFDLQVKTKTPYKKATDYNVSYRF